jgi:MFS family permease
METPDLYPRLCAASVFLHFSYALARSPIVPLYAQSLGATPEQVGLAVAASTLTGIFIKLPAGTLSDVLGRRVLLIIGACVFAFTPFLYVAVASLTGFIILRLVHGNATAIFGPTASATISDVVSVNERGAKLGLYSSLQGVGQALGPLVGGFLISAAGYGNTFLLSGAVGSAGLLLVMTLQPPRRAHEKKNVLAQFRQGLREVASNKSILLLSVIVAIQMFAVGAYNGFIPLFAKDSLGMDASLIGVIFGVQTAVALLARPLVGRLSDRVGRKPLILGGLVWCGITISALPLIPSASLLILLAALWGLGLSTISSVGTAYITDLAKSHQYGAAHGTFGTIFDLGEAMGPLVAGVLVSHAGFPTMFILMGALLMISALIFFSQIKGGTQ